MNHNWSLTHSDIKEFIPRTSPLPRRKDQHYQSDEEVKSEHSHDDSMIDAHEDEDYIPDVKVSNHFIPINEVDEAIR